MSQASTQASVTKMNSVHVAENTQLFYNFWAIINHHYMTSLNDNELNELFGQVKAVSVNVVHSAHGARAPQTAKAVLFQYLGHGAARVHGACIFLVRSQCSQQRTSCLEPM